MATPSKRLWISFWRNVERVLRLMMPGLGLKRWLIVVLLGTTLLGVGLAVLVLDVYRNAPETWWLPILSYASLRFLARPLRVLIFGSLGVGLVLIGILGINRAILAPFTRPGRNVIDEVTTHSRRKRGPRIVALGGGHGLATLLRGLKEYSHNITAVVTVADDGGSSGRLRQSLGILPPGDIRNCLAALSNDEALLTQLFQYRFAKSDNGSEAGLEGHSFGNLFISALAEITGSFEEGVAESGRVLSVFGRVLPATLHDVQLTADVALPLVSGEVRVEGESRIPRAAGKVRRVWLEPNDPPAYPKVIQAILSADILLVGPGSLYTSILPNLMVPDIVKAIQASRGLKIFICNVANQPGETDDYSCPDYLQAIEDHVKARLFDLVICNDSQPALPNLQYVADPAGITERYPVYRSDLLDESNPARHDSAKLAQVIMDLYEERTGPILSD